MEQYRYAILAVSILLGVIGQLLLKWGATRGGGVVAQFLSLWSIGGLGCYFAAAMGYMLVLRSLPLSVAYPTVATSYIVVMVASHFVFQEPLTWNGIAGVVCIIFGIFLVHSA